jgi:hypothetical protein
VELYETKKAFAREKQSAQWKCLRANVCEQHIWEGINKKTFLSN